MQDDMAKIIMLLEEIRDELREIRESQGQLSRETPAAQAQDQAGRRIGSTPNMHGYASIKDDGSWDSGSIDDLIEG